MFPRLSKRESQIFVLCVLMALIFVGFQFIYRPIRSQENLVDQRINVTKKKIKKNIIILKDEKSVNVVYEEYLKVFGQKLSDQQQTNQVFSQIEAAAKKAEIKIINMKPQRIREEDLFRKFSVSVQAQGTMQLIMKFIYLLEQEPYHFQIEEIRFEKRSIRSEDIRCEIIASRILIDSTL